MSRVAKKPVRIPSGVEVGIDGRSIAVKGPKGAMTLNLHKHVNARQQDGEVIFDSKPALDAGMAMAGTTRALLGNIITGVTAGFERRLELVGVGYRAQMQGGRLNLTLGYSHPVNFAIPEDITIETPTQTEVVVRGIDKQRVGHVAAEIRALRPPEPYKGKGVKFAGEQIVRKEAKKK